MNKMKNVVIGSALALSTLYSTVAMAAQVTVTEDVSQWSVKVRTDYNDSLATPPVYKPSYSIAISNVGANSASGKPCGGTVKLGIWAADGSEFGSTFDDYKIFLNFYLVAKAGGLKMTLVVDDTKQCLIRWFGFDGA
jgi:hypothetical protein